MQAQADIAMDLIFEHFKKSTPVTFYKSASEVVVSANADWNSDFDDPYAANITRTAQSKEIECRIWYAKDGATLKALDGDENLSVKLSYPISSVRIQIKSDDLDWLKDAKCFYIFGEKYIKDSDWRGLGMLQTVRKYEITLKRNQ